jgi:hypothetical protein
MLHHTHLMTNPKSAHFRPTHGDTPATQTLTETQVVATGESCAPQQQPVAPPAQGQAPVQPVPPVLPVMPVTPVQPVLPVTPAQPGSSAAPTTSRGGVLGEHVVVTKPAATQAKPAAHGVLGTVTHVAGTSLPFTGFPLWVAALVALGLIGGGLAPRHPPGAGRVSATPTPPTPRAASWPPFASFSAFPQPAFKQAAVVAPPGRAGTTAPRMNPGCGLVPASSSLEATPSPRSPTGWTEEPLKAACPGRSVNLAPWISD